MPLEPASHLGAAQTALDLGVDAACNLVNARGVPRFGAFRSAGGELGHLGSAAGRSVGHTSSSK